MGTFSRASARRRALLASLLVFAIHLHHIEASRVVTSLSRRYGRPSSWTSGTRSADGSSAPCSPAPAPAPSPAPAPADSGQIATRSSSTQQRSRQRPPPPRRRTRPPAAATGPISATFAAPPTQLRGPPPAGHTQQPPATRAPALGPAPAYAPPATNPAYPPPAYPSPAAPGAYPLPLALSTYPPDDSSALDTPAAPSPPAPALPPHPRRPAFPPWPPFRPRAPKLVTPADDDQLPPGVEVAADPPVAACAAWHVAAAGDTCAALADSYGLPYGSGLYLNGPYSSGAGGSTAASTSGGGSAGADAGSSDAAAGSGPGPGPGWTWLQRINPRLDCAAGPQPGAALCVHRAQQWPPPPGGCARAHVLADGQSCDQVLQMYGTGGGGGGGGGGAGGGGLLPGGLEELYDLNPGLDCRGLLRGLVLCLKARA